MGTGVDSPSTIIRSYSHSNHGRNRVLVWQLYRTVILITGGTDPQHFGYVWDCFNDFLYTLSNSLDNLPMTSPCLYLLDTGDIHDYN